MYSCIRRGSVFLIIRLQMPVLEALMIGGMMMSLFCSKNGLSAEECLDRVCHYEDCGKICSSNAKLRKHLRAKNHFVPGLPEFTQEEKDEMQALIDECESD